MGRDTRVENHWLRCFSQNNEWRLNPPPTVLLYSVKLKNTYVVCGKTRNCYWRDQYLKFPSKQNTSSACFDSNWRNHLKNHGIKILTSRAYLSSDVSLWLGQIFVFSRFEIAGIGATLRCSRNFFIMIHVHKKQNNHKEGKSNDCSS